MRPCPHCKGVSNHAAGFDCRGALRLDEATVFRIAVTKQFQRINDELRDLRAELDKIKESNRVA